MNLPPVSRMTRRTALSAAAGSLVGVAACTPNSANAPARRGREEPAAEPAADPDVVLAATVLADEQDLLDRVEATIGRHRALEQLLTPALTAHAAHVALLEEAAPADALPELSTSASPGPAASPSADAQPPQAGSPTRVPRDRRRAVLALARREEDLALVDKRSAFAAESGAFARVLAGMAASAAQQATLLRQSQAPAQGAAR